MKSLEYLGKHSGKITSGGISGIILVIVLNFGWIEENIIIPYLDKYLGSRKGGFRTEISNKLNIPNNEVVNYITHIIEDANNRIEVGIVVYRDDPKKYYFINTDGEFYPATHGEDDRWYYWDEIEPTRSKWKLCF